MRQDQADISIKVRNWESTITVIPTNKLIHALLKWIEKSKRPGLALLSQAGLML